MWPIGLLVFSNINILSSLPSSFVSSFLFLASYLPLFFPLLSLFTEEMQSALRHHCLLAEPWYLSPGLDSEPLIEMRDHEDGGIWLECISGGWYLKPLTVWRDPYSEVVPALKEISTPDTEGLFIVTTAVITRDNLVRNVSCSINDTLFGQKKESVIFIPG